MIYGRYVGKYGIIQKVLREGEGSLNNKNEHRKLGWGRDSYIIVRSFEKKIELILIKTIYYVLYKNRSAQTKEHAKNTLIRFVRD